MFYLKKIYICFWINPILIEIILSLFISSSGQLDIYSSPANVMSSFRAKSVAPECSRDSGDSTRFQVKFREPESIYIPTIDEDGFDEIPDLLPSQRISTLNRKLFNKSFVKL